MKNAEAAILQSEGGGSNKFEDWVGIKNLALLHFYTLPYPTLSLLMTLNEET